MSTKRTYCDNCMQPTTYDTEYLVENTEQKCHRCGYVMYKPKNISMSTQKSIEEIVEEVARCRFTGNPKTYHSEESYKTTLTIVLARIFKSERDRAEEEKREVVRKAISIYDLEISPLLDTRLYPLLDKAKQRTLEALTNPQDKQ